jgi:hypothetical protein
MTQITKPDHKEIGLRNTRFAGDDRAQDGHAAKKDVDVGKG